MAIVPRAQTCWGVTVSVVYSMQSALGGYFTGCHGQRGVASIAPWDGRERTSVVDIDASHPWDGIHGKHGFPRSRASGTGDRRGLLSVVGVDSEVSRVGRSVVTGHHTRVMGERGRCGFVGVVPMGR